MENVIRHEGVVESIDGVHVKVRIVQTSACAGCKIASHCTTADAREKIVDATVREGSRWQVGQTVVVTTERSMAGRALLLGFGLPLVVMLAVLVAAMIARCSESTTALLMFASLIPYYTVLWFCRDGIARKVSFKIED